MSSAEQARLNRIVIAGLSGDSGKTFLSLGITRAFKEKGLNVAAFKKGPDFIDAAWLGTAAGSPARNLDTYLMPAEAIRRTLIAAARKASIAVIEGNRGLYDGVDSSGSHSTAELSKLIRAPVVLVLDTTKATRTVAALILGCCRLDRDVEIAGVILNRVGTARQESVIRRAIREAVDLPVLGAVPRIREVELPSRHLGLVTAVEHPRAEQAIENTARIARKYLDLDALVEIAGRSPRIEAPKRNREERAAPPGVRIGVLRDRAFSFYYPENLEALENSGGDLIEISPLEDEALPEIDGLYAGGGFPEVFAQQLSANRNFREILKKRMTAGLPVWAECGGLIYLSRAVRTGEGEFPMVGVLPIITRQMSRPQGHGYVKARVDRENPFFETDLQLVGHEFHYTRLEEADEPFDTVMKLEKGTGVGRGRDGILQGAGMAAYTHLHALGTPAWAPAFLKAVSKGGPV